MQSNRIVPLAGILVFLTFASGAAAGGDVDRLVAQTIREYGGEKALRAAPAVRHVGEVTSILRKNAVGTIVREFEPPGKLRVEIRYPPDFEVRVYNGEAGWRQGKVVTGAPRDAMVLQTARMALPLVLLDRRKDLIDRGRTTFEGKEVRTLELPLGNRLSLTVDIDPLSGRIVRSSGKGGDRGDGVPLVFVTNYTDFRVVGGLLHPFRERNIANGFVTGETTLSKVEVRRSFPPETFLP